MGLEAFDPFHSFRQKWGSHFIANFNVPKAASWQIHHGGNRVHPLCRAFIERSIPKSPKGSSMPARFRGALYCRTGLRFFRRSALLRQASARL